MFQDLLIHIINTSTISYEGGIVNNTLRPPIPARCDAEWRNLVEECRSPDPACRPSLTEITKQVATNVNGCPAKTTCSG